MTLRRQDLNLLPILRELIRVRSVSKAAENINLSQSATSGALARLRHVFGDELLVMVGRNMVATPFAISMQTRLEQACHTLEQLYAPIEFDPRTVDRQFNIAATDYAAFLMAGRVARHFLNMSCVATVRFHPMGENLETHLLHGDIDIALMSDRAAHYLGTDLERRALFSDERVVIASRTNPSFDGPLTLQTYLSASHVTFELHQFDSLHINELWPEIEPPPNRVLSLPHFTAIPEAVAQSGCLALIQKRLALQMAQGNTITIHPVPFEAPSIRISAYWSPLCSNDPAIGWMIDQLEQLGAALPPI